MGPLDGEDESTTYGTSDYSTSNCCSLIVQPGIAEMI